MDAKDALRSTSNLSSMVLKSYISDLDDADLMRRPGEGCNHLAWQLGHLIASEVQLLEMVARGQATTLPDGFAEAHSKDACGNDDPGAFLEKSEYEELFDKVRGASLAALEAMSDADLDQPGPEAFSSVCPTVGDLFSLIASHPMMHAGQFVVVRRQLGKPILM
ncbi:DinB superfamily protein [Maioricimonas rarisocia]|uniref:DinB superfamily protein n=1 Tax=Maioricimonas rarisocia TaxID=2528026 RepID=A0A517ZAL9_9PLAN|nr:DinB family protein [Maioricimonas rarisocia]QDU39546.1 DinB superfamily protein [Maioricimonas rarisocia]